MIGGLFLIIDFAAPLPEPSFTDASAQPAAVHVIASSTASDGATPAATVSQWATPASDAPSTAPVTPAAPAVQNNPNEIHRIENPYPTPPLSFEGVNTLARPALINIFCASTNGSVRPISGSGVIIDARGVVLTNAHVAQYVLLAESGQVNIYCQARTGSPATPAWGLHVLYLPPAWIDAHAKDIRSEKPLGTGKHDYALLYIGAPLSGSPRPASFPALSVDVRNAVGFIEDPILTVSYPAEFLGNIASTQNLYPVTSTTRIKDLYTLGTGTVDVLSIGGIISAQSGSSGGGIVNAWGRLIGVITTTSEGQTTDERDLRGITLAYVERDMAAQSGTSLTRVLSGNPAQTMLDFSLTTAPRLVEKLLEQLR